MSRARKRQLGGIDQMPSGRWRVRIADPVTGARVSIGTFTTKAEAELAFAKALTSQDKGAWVAPSRGRTTLAEYAPEWLDTRLTSRGEVLRPKTRELYDSFLRLHILPALGDTALSRLSTSRVRSWHSRLLATGPGPSTAAKCYRLLRTMLNTAVEDGLLAVNPCSIKGAGVEPNEERSIPTLAEVDALADAIRVDLRALVLLAAFVGLRRGELLALTRRDIDLLHRTINVRVQRQEAKGGGHLITAPKTDAGRRRVVIPASLVPELEAHLERWAGSGPDGILFPGTKGGPLRICVWQREWTRTKAELGLPDVRLHDLRHVAGTLAASTGAGTKELMHRLGHASPRAALLYQHATAQRDAAIADAIDAQLAAGRAAPSASVLRIADR
ncbi:MAG: tyrosine-type recombinase/integrase [Acidimicrobiia bacterium]|nr:tyrosine-type recombinase/integrase [Acidimicrobiia bacterium]